METPQKTELSPVIKFEKTNQLVREFGLKAPSLETYQTVANLLKQGSLPLVKSIDLDTAEYLFDHGKLKPAREMGGDGSGFGGIYTSLVLAKSYGAVSLVLKPEVLKRRSFTAYAVDHATTYVQEQIKPGLTEDEIMQKYKLTPDEFFEFYSFCVASLTDHTINEYDRQEYEKTTRFLTFDITLPSITLDDLQQVFVKQSEVYNDALKSQMNTVRKKMKATKITEVPNSQQKYRFYQFCHISSDEAVILDNLKEQHNIPEKIIPACMQIA